jgi:hypothetical protein
MAVIRQRFASASSGAPRVGRRSVHFEIYRGQFALRHPGSSNIPMAKNVLSVLSRTSATDKGADLVDQIAALSHGGKMRRCTSLAAKFRHFVIDENLFPIYDEAARQTIRLHLGKQYVNDNTTPYATFCKNFGQLRTAVGFEGLPRVMDRYLWIVGMYMKWKKERLRRAPQIGVELRDLFERPSGKQKAVLRELLPGCLDPIEVE